MGPRRLGLGKGQPEARARQGERSRLALQDALEPVDARRADEVRHEARGRTAVELEGLCHLLEAAVAQHGHPVAQGHGLLLVVGDVEHGRPEPALEPGELGAHLHPQLRVEVREGLVEQEGLRLAHERAAQGHALALASGELGRTALEHGLEAETRRGVGHPARDLRGGRAAHAQAEAQVLAHALVRVERVALEYHGHVAVARRDVGHVALAQPDPAARRRLQAGHQAERRGLSAARRADQHQDLPVGRLQVDPLEGHVAAGVDLVDLLEPDGRHA